MLTLQRLRTLQTLQTTSQPLLNTDASVNPSLNPTHNPSLNPTLNPTLNKDFNASANLQDNTIKALVRKIFALIDNLPYPQEVVTNPQLEQLFFDGKYRKVYNSLMAGTPITPKIMSGVLSDMLFTLGYQEWSWKILQEISPVTVPRHFLKDNVNRIVRETLSNRPDKWKRFLLWKRLENYYIKLEYYQEKIISETLNRL